MLATVMGISGVSADFGRFRGYGRFRESWMLPWISGISENFGHFRAFPMSPTDPLTLSELFSRK